MHLSSVGLVAFFWGTIFALGAHSCLGAKKLSLMQILPLHSRGRPKKRTKVFFENVSNGVGLVAFFWGTIFAWGTHFRLGAQKSPMVRILPSHSRVNTKNKTKRSLSQMHHNGVCSVVFLGGDTFSLGGIKIPFGMDFALTFGVNTKNKTKRFLSQMHPNSVGSVASFRGHILAWGHKNPLWYGFCFHIWGEH